VIRFTSARTSKKPQYTYLGHNISIGEQNFETSDGLQLKWPGILKLAESELGRRFHSVMPR
jgi:hypothetical protein